MDANLLDKIKNQAEQASRNQQDSTPPTPALSAVRNGIECSDQLNLWPKDFHGPQINLDWHPSLTEAVNRLISWYNKPAGGLVLAGGYGCGKTTMAKIALHAVGGPVSVINWESGQPESIRNAVFYSEPELLEDIRRTFGPQGEGSEQQIVSNCQRAKLLIFDDVGAGYVKDESRRWYEDILWRILNERTNKKTLITTNLMPPDLQSRIGGRAYSRLKELLSSSDNYVYLFDVPDYRAKDW